MFMTLLPRSPYSQEAEKSAEKSDEILHTLSQNVGKICLKKYTIEMIHLILLRELFPELREHGPNPRARRRRDGGLRGPLALRSPKLINISLRSPKFTSISLRFPKID